MMLNHTINHIMTGDHMTSYSEDQTNTAVSYIYVTVHTYIYILYWRPIMIKCTMIVNYNDGMMVKQIMFDGES